MLAFQQNKKHAKKRVVSKKMLESQNYFVPVSGPSLFLVPTPSPEEFTPPVLGPSYMTIVIYSSSPYVSQAMEIKGI